MKKQKLPNRLSDLIEVALNDLNKVERMKSKYIVDMGTWHEPDLCRRRPPILAMTSANTKTKCFVCFAGSVMACTLKASPENDLSPADFDRDTRIKLDILNYVRYYNWESALELLQLVRNWKYSYYKNVCNKIFPKFVESDFFTKLSYKANPKIFKKNMRKAIRELRKMGL